jgi:hypothetical protein
LSNPKHPKFKANYDKWIKKNPGKKLADFVAAMKKKDAAMNEAMDDLTDLDDYQFADPDKDTAVSPVTAKQAAADRRRRLQDIEDRKAEKDDWFSGNDKQSNVRIHKAKLQDEPEELDEYSQAEYDQAMTDFKSKGGRAQQLPAGSAKNPISTASRHIGGRGEVTKKGKGTRVGRDANTIPSKPVVDVAEVAPPGAKAERMVKHIKKGYAKDGNLSKREKGIAYATAWKAKKEGNLEEGTEFKDAGKIKNSAPNMKKAKLAKVTEGRVMEETDYFYEKIGKALAEQNPHLDTATGEFVDAVRKEMVAQGIPPNRARGIILQDEDFISDVATSYGHYCTVDARHPLPAEIDLGNVNELDEIARLAGLPVQETDMVYDEVNYEESADTMDEDALGAVMGGVAGAVVGKSPQAAATGAKLGSAARDAFNDATGLEELTAPPLATPGKAPAAKATGMAPSKPKVPPTPTFNEEDMAEGNEFSGALAAAKASGAKEFEVDGKRYTVKEDININITASGEQDALNLIRKLSGMDEVETVRNVGPVMDAESAIAQGIVEPVEEERDIEYSNTPNEKIGPISAAISSGDDLHKSKQSYSDKPYRGDNPMAVKEDTLWKKYAGMLKGLIK